MALTSVIGRCKRYDVIDAVPLFEFACKCDRLDNFSTSIKRNECSLNFSYAVVVFQWITSCDKKCYEHTCINTFARIRNSFVDGVRYNNVIFIENMSTLKAIKSYFKSRMIKRILHSWLFYMKFILNSPKARLIKD